MGRRARVVGLGIGLGTGLGTGCSDTPLCDGGLVALHCQHHTVEIEGREVHWMAPTGAAPARGRPVMLLFQGAFFPAGTFWDTPRFAPRGLIHQVRLTRELLEAGFVVITPEAPGEGLTAWHTNLPTWSESWSASPDAQLMEALFTRMDEGEFGPLDPMRWYAGGVSSGGYMTSRVGITWPERFAGLVVVSGSYATCAGPVCVVPDSLDPGHPPTLFIHGRLDVVVPLPTMKAYARALEAAGVPVETKIKLLGRHAWSRRAPRQIVTWLTER